MSTPSDSQAPPAHPLACDLAERLRGRAISPRLLLLGIGSGRNLAPFLEANVAIDVVEADIARARDAAIRCAALPKTRVTRGSYAGPYAFAGGFDAALSTHALLHGRIADVDRAVAAIANRLQRGALFFATFGSTRDERYAAGTQVESYVSAPQHGSEIGVAHAYFDEPRLRALLAAFSIDEIAERSASESAGRWAHSAREAGEIVHWFVRASKR